MPQENNPPFSINEAEQRGHDIFELFFANWGYAGQITAPVVDFTNLQWPAPPPEVSIPNSLAGIAIGPKSTVDRAWISYNLDKNTVDATDSSPALTDRLRLVSRDTPLLFTIPAHSGSMNDPTQTPVTTMTSKGSLYVFPFARHAFPSELDPTQIVQQTTVLPLIQTLTGGGTGQYRDANGVPREFGDNASTFVAPYLHLYLFLQQPTRFQPNKRAPFMANTLTQISAVGGTEKMVAQIPVYGRRSVHIMMQQQTAGGTCDFRVGALRSIACQQEQPVDEILAVPAGVPTVITPCAGQDFEADYVNLYAKPSAGVPFIRWSVTAYD